MGGRGEWYRQGCFQYSAVCYTYPLDRGVVGGVVLALFPVCCSIPFPLSTGHEAELTGDNSFANFLDWTIS